MPIGSYVVIGFGCVIAIIGLILFIVYAKEYEVKTGVASFIIAILVGGAFVGGGYFYANTEDRKSVV